MRRRTESRNLRVYARRITPSAKRAIERGGGIIGDYAVILGPAWRETDDGFAWGGSRLIYDPERRALESARDVERRARRTGR